MTSSYKNAGKVLAKKNFSLSYGIFISILSLLLLLSIVISLTLGRYPIPFTEVLAILLQNIIPSGIPIPIDALHEKIVEQVRLPRILGATLIGGGLAVAGSAAQGLFRNPLVDSGIIGVTAAAAFGGALGILLFDTMIYVFGLAFGFGMASIVMVKCIATVHRRTSVLTLVLAGVIMGSFFGAGMSIIKMLADPYEKLPAIIFWLMGSIAATNYGDLQTFSLTIIPSCILLYGVRYQLNIISLGEDKARALGLPYTKVQWIVLVCVSVISAAVVASSGNIGWVGLIIPHVARFFVGADHIRLLPVCGIIGAMFLIAVDDVSRTATANEIPIGVVTALIGVPFFLVILRRIHKKSGWNND